MCPSFFFHSLWYNGSTLTWPFFLISSREFHILCFDHIPPLSYLGFLLMVIRKPWPEQLGEVKVYFIFQLSGCTLITGASQDRNSKQKLKQRCWRNTAYPYDLLSLLSDSIQDPLPKDVLLVFYSSPILEHQNDVVSIYSFYSFDILGGSPHLFGQLPNKSHREAYS